MVTDEAGGERAALVRREMERRYQPMAALGVRNISFNRREDVPEAMPDHDPVTTPRAANDPRSISARSRTSRRSPTWSSWSTNSPTS
jgi:DNA segregation ATPase FtsK/SpoIIIE-like protein